MTQKTEAIVSMFAAVFLVVAAFVNLKIAASMAAIYLVALTVIRMLSKRRKQ